MSDLNLLKGSALAKIANAHPIRLFDIGARGGFDRGLWPLAFATEAVGFEPDPVAFEKLRDQSGSVWEKAHIFPVAIGGENGTRTLHVPSDPQAASLLGPTDRTGPARTKGQFFNIRNTYQVETETMDSVLKRTATAPPEFLKIDIEGAELEVLKNSPQTVKHLLGIKVEVAFDKFRSGQPLASEVMAFLEDAGFVLMDFISPSHWRTESNVLHPLTDKAPYHYSRGQMVHGDLLYFRRPGEISPEQGDPVARKLQLGLIALSLGYMDFAAEVYREPEVRLAAEKLGCADLNSDILSYAKTYGRIEARKAFFGRLRGFGPNLRRWKDVMFR